MAKRATKKQRQLNEDAAATATGLRDLIESADGLLESVKGQSGEAADILRQKVSATAEEARERLADLGAAIGGIPNGALETARVFIREDPWRAAALAALGYIALSMLFGRRAE